VLSRLTHGNKAAPMVYFCVDAQCWLSYNASLRAAALGYTEVYWYRGGIVAWRAAGLPLKKINPPGQGGFAEGKTPARGSRDGR
jgi:PQQ-dependent catabolism-associated CXXCW motif protein